jgi:hypothetical protein
MREVSVAVEQKKKEAIEQLKYDTYKIHSFGL